MLADNITGVNDDDVIGNTNVKEEEENVGETNDGQDNVEGKTDPGEEDDEGLTPLHKDDDEGPTALNKEENESNNGDLDKKAAPEYDADTGPTVNEQLAIEQSMENKYGARTEEHNL
jgi:hypothetical protein